MAAKPKEYLWFIKAPGHVQVPVVAADWEQATVQAARFWDVPWAKIFCKCELVRKSVVIRNVCCRCGVWFHGSGVVCDHCRSEAEIEERRARAVEALNAVGLGERIHFRPNQLSGGQCQRVAIARAMVTKPTLLLADEPTGALDSKSGDQIMEIFRNLSKEGMTIIMITHELAIAQCADKIYHIRDGQLRESEEEADHAQA